MKRYHSLPYILLALLLPVTAYAQGGGGGGGGGGAGGGGGGDAGGGNGVSSAGDYWFLLVGAVIFIIAGIYERHSRPTLISVSLVLRRGQRYGRALDEIVSGADFTTRRGRLSAIYLLVSEIRPADIHSIRMKELGCTDRNAASATLEAAWRDELEQTGIQPRLLNIAPPHGSPEYFNHLPPPTPETTNDESVCFLGLLLAAHSTLSASELQPNDFMQYLRNYERSLQKNRNDMYYIYYTPKSPATDAPLGAEEAMQMLAKLSAPERETIAA